IWDAKTGQAVGDPLQGHDDWVTSVAFSSDEKNIVSGSRDETIQIWDAKTGQAVSDPLQGHDDLVTSVAFSSDEKNIVSGSHDKTIQIWDAKTGQAVMDDISLSYNPFFLFNDAHGLPCFTQQCTLDKEGWLSLPKHEDSPLEKLLLWIPPNCRSGLWWPGNIAVISSYLLNLDFSQFHHGEEWVACYIKSQCSKCHYD
ncbi:hypothetical protein M422DRAFT_190307, partial [Sphaerobolus stellatus SS14]